MPKPEKTYAEMWQDLAKKHGEIYWEAHSFFHDDFDTTDENASVSMARIAEGVRKFGAGPALDALRVLADECVAMHRLMTMSEDELDGELRELGIEPEQAQAIVNESFNQALLQHAFEDGNMDSLRMLRKRRDAQKKS